MTGTNWVNTQTLSLVSGTLNLGGTFTTAGLGTFNRTGGTVNLVGVVAGLLTCFAVVASWTAYRVNQDRLQIKKQRDEITKQKDEITSEKGISDDRLTLYRSTVSKMVNRAPRLLDGAPIGTGTRNELMGLLNDILNPSEDSDDSGIVGSAKKWAGWQLQFEKARLFWRKRSH